MIIQYYFVFLFLSLKYLLHRIIESMSKEKITENRVIIENGEVKTVLCEETQQSGWMTIEESRRLCHEMVDKTREILKQRNANISK